MKAKRHQPSVTIAIGTPLREAVCLIIEATLRHTEGNVALAARMLEIDRTTVYQKINKQNR